MIVFMLVTIRIAQAGLCEWQLELKNEIQARRAAIETRFSSALSAAREQARPLKEEKQQDLEALEQRVRAAEKALAVAASQLSKHETELRSGIRKASALEWLLAMRLQELKLGRGIFRSRLRAQIAGIGLWLEMERNILESEQRIGESLHKAHAIRAQTVHSLREELAAMSSIVRDWEELEPISKELFQARTEAKEYPEVAIEMARVMVLRNTDSGQALEAQFKTLHTTEAAFDQFIDDLSKSQVDSIVESIRAFDAHCDWLGVPLLSELSKHPVKVIGFFSQFDAALKKRRLELEEESRKLGLKVLKELEINLDPPL